MKNTLKIEGLIALFLFVALWLYLTLRAVYVPMVHDELVTVHAYMLSGKWFPFSGYVDANNHLLNSALGSIFISLFGFKNYLIPRLPNLLAFPLFFWSLWFLGKELFQNKFLKWGCILVLCFTPYFLEFFALARGYGLSMGWFMVSLLGLVKFQKQLCTKWLWVTSLAIVGALLSNLTLIFVGGGILVLLGLVMVISKQNKASSWAPIGLIILTLGFVLWYGLQLQGEGKLYYGSDEGFFVLTINSLAKELLHVEGNLVQIVIGILGLLVLIGFGIQLSKKLNTQNLKSNPWMIFPFLLLVAVAAILISNWVLGINFPEDRAALFLFPVFVLSFFTQVEHYIKTTWAKYGLSLLAMLFPLMLMANLNLSHSIFWKHDHIHQKFVKTIDNFIKENEALPTMAGKIIHQSVWGQAGKEANLQLPSLQRYKNKTDTIADFHLVLLNRYPQLNNYYNVEFFDEISGLSLVKRKSLLKRKLLAEKTIQKGKREDEFISLWNNFSDSLAGKHIYLFVEGEIKRENFPSEMVMVSQDQAIDGANTYYEVYGYDMMLNPQEDNVKLGMYIPSVENPKGAGFYLWNKEKFPLEINNLKLRLYTLEP